MQSTKNILLIRPSSFVFNPETAASNAFQIKPSDSEDLVKQKVFAEFEAFVSTLQLKGVNVFVFNDTHYPIKPDAIFPNNWVTFHPDGTVILYPMFAPNRRYERRQDIIDLLKKNFNINHVLDLSKYEKEQRFLEGTGSMVFDHNNKIAYACLSPRTDKNLLLSVCDYLQYKPIYFYAHDPDGKEIYHTNVMMCIGEKFAVICLNSITDKQEREKVSQLLSNTGHQIIDITFKQMNNFAGNMLAIQTNNNQSILALSQSSFDSLTPNQRQEIEKFCDLVPLSIYTIETIGGGSARCMISEIFLKSK